MSNEHIGRLRQFGLAKQSAAGTPVSPSIWIPTTSPVDFKPVYEKIRDESVYGVVDDFAGDEHVAIKKAEVGVECLMRDESVGHFLKAAFGTETLVYLITISGASGGSPARGDSISSVSGSCSGVIRKVITIGAVTYYAISVATGSIGDFDAVSDLTNGTWTGGTVEQSDFSAAYGHYFTRTNDNSTHPIYSLYSEDPIAGRETSDAALQSLDIELMPDQYPKINAMFKGINVVDGGSLTPADTSENLFKARHAAVYLGDAETDLNGATAEVLRRFKLSINKNLKEEQKLGQDGAISGFFPQNFSVMGDFEALFNSETYRNYHLTNSSKAMRMLLADTDATPIVDLTADIVPSLYIDMYKTFFEAWTQANENNGIIGQTLGYKSHYDKDTAAIGIDALLINTRSTVY